MSSQGEDFWSKHIYNFIFNQLTVDLTDDDSALHFELRRDLSSDLYQQQRQYYGLKLGFTVNTDRQ